MQIPCFGLSIITDLGVPGKIVKVTHQDVQDVAKINVIEESDEIVAAGTSTVL